MKNTILYGTVYHIISEVCCLEQLTLLRISFQASRKPGSLGDEELIFFNPVGFNMIPSPEEKYDPFFIFLEMVFLLWNQLKASQKKCGEVT